MGSIHWHQTSQEATTQLNSLISLKPNVHSHQNIGMYCICGDFNARSGRLQDSDNVNYAAILLLIMGHQMDMLRV